MGQRVLNRRLIPRPDPACASVCPWALARTSLICISRYTCKLHCIVMLILLCKEFYCYLLKISLSHPNYSAMDELLGIGETSPISISMIFSPIPPSEHQFSFKENGCIPFQPLILNCKLQKYLFQMSTPCSGDFNWTSVISLLESSLLKL